PITSTSSSPGCTLTPLQRLAFCPPETQTTTSHSPRKGAAHDDTDPAGGVEGPGGALQAGGPPANARPVQAGPSALRQVLPALQRHPAGLLQEPRHRGDAGAARGAGT